MRVTEASLRLEVRALGVAPMALMASRRRSRLAAAACGPSGLPGGVQRRLAPVCGAAPGPGKKARRPQDRRQVRCHGAPGSAASSWLNRPAAHHIAKLQHPQSLPLLRPTHRPPQKGTPCTGQITCYLDRSLDLLPTILWLREQCRSGIIPARFVGSALGY